MLTKSDLSLGLAFAGLLWAAEASAAANSVQAPSTVPIFSPTSNVGWVSYGPDFIPAPSGPQPVTFDPAHPFVENGIEYNAARPGTKDENAQSTFPVADLSNPILQPWARDELRKHNEQVLTGRPLYSRMAACWPMGVPGFHLYVVFPIFFLQTPKEAVLIGGFDHQVRHVYLNVPHSRNPKPTWYGESVGHYEGDTLVVDTIGISTKVFIDNYRTPHSDRLHVNERFRIVESGNMLEVKVHIEDPDAFTTPWDAIQRYSRVEREPLGEMICAENNVNPFHDEYEAMPEATSPDF